MLRAGFIDAANFIREELVLAKDDEERLEIIEFILGDYCLQCGKFDPVCECLCNSG